MAKKRGRGLVTGSKPEGDDHKGLPPAPAKGRPKGQGVISRSTQLAGTRAAARARKELAAMRKAQADGEVDEATEMAYADEEDMDGDPSTWAIRCQISHDAWVAGASSNVAEFIDCLGKNMERSQALRKALKVHLQSELDAWQPSTCSCGSELEAMRCPDGKVTYYGRTCTFKLKVNKSTCPSCHKQSSPSPLAFGCFPSTPKQPTLWWELELFHLYRKAAHVSGLSISGWLIHSTHQFLGIPHP